MSPVDLEIRAGFEMFWAGVIIGRFVIGGLALQRARKEKVERLEKAEICCEKSQKVLDGIYAEIINADEVYEIEKSLKLSLIEWRKVAGK